MNKENIKNGSYTDALEQRKRQGQEDADKIRPILEKDPDWLLVSGKQKPVTNEEHRREKRALTRLTKKAANLLFPQFKALSCYGSGTAHYWVHVNIVVPEKNIGLPEQKNIEQRVTETLISTRLKYSMYLPDSFPGKDDWTPCLSVRVNDLSWGHY
jgi:hypothetical protein